VGCCRKQGSAVNVSDEDIAKWESALATLLGQMDVPIMREQNKDWRWMLRNLGVRNAENPMYGTAVGLLKKIMKYKRV
jgi:hypothetical protein